MITELIAPFEFLDTTMEDFTCLYLALVEQSEQAQPTNQPNQAPRSLPIQHYQQSEQLPVVDDDYGQSVPLYPTLYL